MNSQGRACQDLIQTVAQSGDFERWLHFNVVLTIDKV